MAKKNEAHDLVVENLSEALLQLMKKKPLIDINVTELCKRAGVSRISFYRNYNSMNDILAVQLAQCTDEWWGDLSKKTEDEFYLTFWTELLDLYRKNNDLIRLIYENNVSHILKEHIFSCCAIVASPNESDAYNRAALAGAIFGLVDEWIRRGMGVFPNDFSLQNLTFTMP